MILLDSHNLHIIGITVISQKKKKRKGFLSNLKQFEKLEYESRTKAYTSFTMLYYSTLFISLYQIF
jgi:hypothetical protein